MVVKSDIFFTKYNTDCLTDKELPYLKKMESIKQTVSRAVD
jgi:hypothetical protein